MKIILALVIFSAIILFHELGHFLLARANKIVVTEFSLGMGPRLLSTVRGQTRYSLKALPFGGSCAMLGEDSDQVTPGTFNSAPVWGRFSVVAAGPVFNFILGFILSLVIVSMAGYDPALVTSVKEDGAAYEAGLREGDRITSYNGYHVDLARDLYVYMYMNPLKEGEAIRLTVERDGKQENVSYLPDVTVRYLLGFNRSGSDSMTVQSLIPGMPLEEAGVQPGDTIIRIDGIDIANGEDYENYIAQHPLDGSPIRISYERDGLEYEAVISPGEYKSPSGGFAYNTGYQPVKGLAVLKYAGLEMKYMIRTTLLSLKELFGGSLSLDDLSGPVGVVDAIGEAYEESRSEGLKVILINLLSMAVLLTANLGVMNLLPIPALDGGRLVFLLLEAIRRKPINRSVEGGIHFTGLLLLMALMLFVMYSDILKLL